MNTEMPEAVVMLEVTHEVIIEMFTGPNPEATHEATHEASHEVIHEATIEEIREVRHAGIREATGEETLEMDRVVTREANAEIHDESPEAILGVIHAVTHEVTHEVTREVTHEVTLEVTLGATPEIAHIQDTLQIFEICRGTCLRSPERPRSPGSKDSSAKSIRRSKSHASLVYGL